MADRLQATIDAAVADQPRMGIAAAVIAVDAGTWSSFAGRDRTGSAIDLNAKWHTGSLAKTVVAAEVMRLAERGHLRLDDLAADHIRGQPQLNTNGASVRDLLRMRSGLGTGLAPGTTFEYSNDDYVLLGHVIEGTERRALGDVLTTDILKVRGAERLTFPADGDVSNAAGPLETDASSMARWGYALFGEDLISRASLALMVDFDGEYGMGVFDFSMDFGRPAAGHLGQEDTWSAAMVVFPEQRTIIVTLMNSGDWERTYRVLADLAEALPS